MSTRKCARNGHCDGTLQCTPGQQKLHHHRHRFADAILAVREGDIFWHCFRTIHGQSTRATLSATSQCRKCAPTVSRIWSLTYPRPRSDPPNAIPVAGMHLLRSCLRSRGTRASPARPSSFTRRNKVVRRLFLRRPDRLVPAGCGLPPGRPGKNCNHRRDGGAGR